ncbi:protein CYCLOPS-like isoform X4 [Papaver somniferum]|nr:protein CYCLOPS-like isoform X4 [Papaver somniferum]XP_026401881.1 protein CYCLOPS-like isoform X4 [Papaver somniferum]XP_026401882.1 protein CYCLOPS-like isoform X4 [Papaver somniferum]XP_026401883.1 protein CYCLOPS-like isoform X4 [Papaver somniferum]XP_026401884.1 protein CYCLOPS-like isoform X4 [Papaver somniferum]
MVLDGDWRSSMNNSLIQMEGDNHQNPNYLDSHQVVQRSDKEKSFMEIEGRGISEFLRNSSEEIFLKSLIEGSLGLPTPTMEMLGFKNLSQSFRADSEELFNSWLNNGEINGHNSTGIAHRTRQASRRMSTELAALVSQQHGNTDILFPQTLSIVDEISSDQEELPFRNVEEKGTQASNMYLAKAWFQSSQPMTRSRSSELRRRYTAMQNCQSSNGIEATHSTAPEHGFSRMRPQYATTSSFSDVHEIPSQPRTFMSPSNSTTSSFSNAPILPVDAVSSVVSMLKGTLERKKLINQMEKETIESSQFRSHHSQEVSRNPSFDQGQMVHHILEPQPTYEGISGVEVKRPDKLQTFEGAIDIDLDGFVAPPNQIQMGYVCQEPSQSESSAAAPGLSTGFEVYDGPISGQTPSGCESLMKQVANGSLENGSRAKEFRERIHEKNSRDDRKTQHKGSLVRMGSVTSGGTVDKADPTKKRRVERSRKMAEAKERNQSPVTPSDMQSILKRCEILEKEVRSLKLNLSFMNRKDSEQTKQIEDLQKQNEDLADEKERLLEEIERIISGSGIM